MEEKQNSEEISLNDARTVEELIGKSIYLTENELKIYLMGRMLIEEVGNDNNFKDNLKAFITTPKFMELLLVTMIIIARKIPIHKVVK